MSGDQFAIEGPITANALTASTTAPIAREAWADGYVLQYSAADGKLHPVAVPAGPAPSGAANLLYATPDGSSGAASLRALVADDIADGLLANAKLANYSVTVNTSGGVTGGGTLSLGGVLSLSLSGIPSAALAYSSFSIDTAGPLTGGGSVALGGTINLGISSGVLADWGDGSDGAVTLGAGTTTLTKTMNYTTLTVPSGATLNTAGFGIYASTSVTVASGGIVQNSGTNASGVSPGSAAPGVRFGNGSNGGLGTTAAGNSGSTATLGAGGQGGAGGAGTSGAGGAGGGLAGGVTSDTGGYLTIWSREFGQGVPGFLYRGGSGGGGGGGNGVQTGGGGGGGGGWLVIKAPSITVAGTVRANGGDGAAGLTSNCGGGGGGGGGIVSLIYLTLTQSGTVQAAGGTKGATGGGSGVAGSDGNAGRVLTRQIA